MSIESSELIELINVVEIVSTVEAENDEPAEDKRLFKFLAATNYPRPPCKNCLKYDGRLMTVAEIEAEFPYLDKWSDNIWLPKIHPHCYCMLILWDIDTLTAAERSFAEFWIKRYIGDKNVKLNEYLHSGVLYAR